MKNRYLWLKRLGWLVLIWTLSVLVLALITYGLRYVMRAVGFHI